MSLTSNQNRNSSIELLKLIALVMIAFSHAMPMYSSQFDGYMNLALATDSIQRFVIVLFRYGGGVGNCIFIICSAWFLLDGKGMNLKKVWRMFCDVFVISIIFLVATLAAGIDISSKDIIRQIFPLTFATNWFICCYIVFYLIHPAFNLLIDRLTKRQHLIIAVTLLIVYGGLATLYSSAFYYTNLVGFIMVYFVVGYVKYYLHDIGENIKINVGVCFISGIILLGLLVLTNYLGLRYSVFSDKLTKWQGFKNPLILLFSLALFNLFRTREFKNRTLNYLASISLFFYLIHENYIMSHYVRSLIFQNIYNTLTYSNELLWVVIMAVSLILFGILGGVLYKEVIQRPVRWISDKLYVLLNRGVNAVVDRMLRMR